MDNSASYSPRISSSHSGSDAQLKARKRDSFPISYVNKLFFSSTVRPRSLHVVWVFFEVEKLKIIGGLGPFDLKICEQFNEFDEVFSTGS